MNNKKKGMDDKKFNFYCSILIFLISILLFSILTSRMKNIITANSGREIGFYGAVLDYGIPALPTAFTEKDRVEKHQSFKDNILNILGIKSKTSLSIIGKEISYLGNVSGEKDDCRLTMRDPENVFDKFSLNEDQVFEQENKVENNQPVKNCPVYDPKLKKKLSNNPEVLIYHTHTCESYKPNIISSKDKTQNVCAVGEEIKKELESKYGIAVLHDTTVHDVAAYNKSYERSRPTVEKYLKQYKDFKIIIDLHRDSIENKDAVTFNINNEKVAKFAFVMTRKNPHFNKNMEVVNKMTSISNKLYPGLYKGLFCYNYGKKFYNQDLNNNMVLMEVGSHVNTIEESKGTGKYVARIIAEYINGKN
ncbi:stage II sporulation protein P [Clostridium sp. MB40-C1]|uniref:stage II sporulation protein P n=1 Tax=Clostridium sp. MB40-C1 TaxID=3070996 RepID=UPI0027DFE365|nr:stage II sporulation protein P [Clostridium sp. MB40-C1]WMJ82320.1 stage II sporulation protein P [Clostridium sp. MB40-C1]